MGRLSCKIILKNTIIENTKGCFMGKMILDDLRKRLEHLATDEDELRASILNDWRYRDFYIRYQEYVERWRPCES